MHIFREIEPLKAHLHQQHLSNFSIGLVPTMGALHQGHLGLVRASKAGNNVTICSIFVNPTQFNNPADLDKYPQTIERDIDLLRGALCDVVFCPSIQAMYPEASQIKFDLGHLDKIIEGEFRPGHFSGVALVVSKLFNIVKPDKAYFGQKDYQQFKIISTLVHELKFNLTLVCIPIVRETDGLAMSSRNMRLNEHERIRAAVIYQCLMRTREGLLRGQSFSVMKNEAFALCKKHDIKLEYLVLADREDLTLLGNDANVGHCILLIAAYVGEVRLIDNIFITENVY